MESTPPPSPEEASSVLEEARLSQTRLAARLRLPSGFFVSIGVAIAAQITATAIGVAGDSNTAQAILVAGVLVFASVAGIQVARLRRLNGVWVTGLVSRVVLGTATTASLAYAAALAGATWAGLAGHWWLGAACSLAGGAGYVAGGLRWMRLYRNDPQANAQAESLWWTAVIVLLMGAGLLLLVLGR